MNKKIIIPTILFVIVLIFSFALLLKNKENDQPKNEAINQENQQTEQSQIILFYGDGCPHCAIVEDFIGENNVKEKLSFEEKEVYYNQKNADDLVEKAKACGIPINSIGVPFLWDGSRCFVGDQDIIDFFNQKINEK
jgi:glutaredoxin